MDSDKFGLGSRRRRGKNETGKKSESDIECDDVTTSIVSLIRVALVYGSCNDGRPGTGRRRFVLMTRCRSHARVCCVPVCGDVMAGRFTISREVCSSHLAIIAAPHPKN